MSANLTLSTFAGLVGSTFSVELGGDRVVETTLVEVDDLTRLHSRDPGSRLGESFSLRFRGRGPLLPQGTYRFAQDALGTFDLFIVPIGRDRDETTYEAIFNRLA